MRWNDRLRVLRWRALEEADAAGECLGTELRREATRAAGEPGKQPAAWLLRRALWLEKSQPARAREALRAMTLPGLSPGAKAVWWVLALLLGAQLSVLGQYRELNVLALPLMGMLLWNAIVMLLSLFAEWRAPKAGSGEGEASGSLLQRWWAALASRLDRGASATGLGEVERTAQASFQAEALPLAQARLGSQVRSGFHIAAALVATGCALAMYARGWSREYLAVWESTLFDAPSAQRFLGSIFAPAAWLTQVPVPVEQIPAMQDSVAHEPIPMPALSWIHLYAGTLALAVVLPRLLLAGFTSWRAGRRLEQQWQALDFPGQAARLQRSIQGSGEHAQVLLHGWRDEARDRWARAIRERLGGQLALEYERIAAGEEDEFVANWQPLLPTTLLVFNAAAIPEAEVQAALAKALRDKLAAHVAGSRLLMLVDATALRDRRSDEGVTTRINLWREMLRGYGEVLVA